ncbi:related to ATP-binding protein, putative pantothenate kinase [Melanopsichium pennsylvanicum]|uniref:Uncharacterized protein n=2 Tax=Melanopsichium pennsylvanicum TaxID=63383 RepID=A0A077R6F6_9BASI|nr:conserved hypothetical protein [Melanopsichium pennsylvanicum 4]SNX83044.1 related to ATP-binding protein, putative pantothenate kinase [Melanopsichium pennsylvanicum]
MAAVPQTRASLSAVDIFAEHVKSQLAQYRSKHSASSRQMPPLFVAMQGPQGSGKTTVTHSLISHLSSSGLSVGILSTDDLYHTHENLVRVARENSSNPLLSGRGQPGTHDVSFGAELLNRIYHINSNPKAKVTLPLFDKSLHSGEGDRTPLSDLCPTLTAPLDVFILEGWSMGFSPISPAEIESKWRKFSTDSSFQRYSLDSLQQINVNLEAYTCWYDHFSVFLQISPTDLKNVYVWRTQQEHAMKASNGGQGMTDQGVRRFVDRYMPGYHLFLDTIQTNKKWVGRSKSVTIDLDRKVVDVSDW